MTDEQGRRTMDKNNFSEIYKKYVMTAYSAAMQVVHNEADADDIAQALIVKVVVSKKIYFLFFQVIRYCSVPDVSINKLSTVIGNHVRHRIRPDYHHFE